MANQSHAFPSPVSALELAGSIDAGALTASTAINRSIETIAAHEAAITAFVVSDPELARAAVKTSRGPLAGLALGVKDVFDTQDFATGMGSPIYAGNRPRGDAPVVALARRNGAVVIGKTVTTELQHRTPVADTRNPHNLEHTPGGSSSGSAAGVAAGMFPLAFGSQTAGSVIRPAAFCGIAGFKPSFRLLPTVGLKCFAWSLDTVGLFGAGVADVAFFAEHLTGRPMRVDNRDAGSPRLGIVRTKVWDEASADMRDAVELAAKRAQSHGAEIVDIDLPDIIEEGFAVHLVIQNHQGSQALAWEMDAHRPLLSGALIEALDAGAAISPEIYDRARSVAKRSRIALKALFEETGIDAILTPSASGAAPEGLSYTGDHTFNRLWTLMGTPAVNVPGLFSSAGLPLGVQIIAPFGRDHACLQAAAFLQAAIA